MLWIIYAVFMTEVRSFQGVQAEWITFTSQQECIQYYDRNKQLFDMYLINAITNYLPRDMKYRVLEVGCMPKNLGKGTPT